MDQSIFFQLMQIEKQGAVFTGLQREMLAMTLEANEGVTLGVALKDVFDYLEIEVDEERLEAIAKRLIDEGGKSQREAELATPLKPQEEDGPSPVQAQKRESMDFGKQLIGWIRGLGQAERLLPAVGFDAEKARRIYIEQDYLVTDQLNALFLEYEWNHALIQLEAAAAPWSGGGKGSSSKGEIEYFDMTKAAEDDPQWAELGRALGGG